MSSAAVSATPVAAFQDNDGGISAMYIIGFSIVGAALLVLILWFAIHFCRKWSARRRQDQLGAAFLSVRGLVKDELTHREKYSSLQIPLFSRNNLSSQVVFPIKAHIKPSSEQFGAERHYITHHLLPDNTPKPFSPTVPSPSPALISDSKWPAVARSSYASSRLSRFSVFSAASSVNEVIVSTTSGGGFGRSIRKVRQTFNPILPDELFIALGESLIILQSFDDGWCVVGREGGGILTSQPKGHDDITPTSGGTVDLGMVPAWCFLKLVKGLRVERPVRSSSFNVTVQIIRPGVNRNDTILWSNF